MMFSHLDTHWLASGSIFEQMPSLDCPEYPFKCLFTWNDFSNYHEQCTCDSSVFLCTVNVELQEVCVLPSLIAIVATPGISEAYLRPTFVDHQHEKLDNWYILMYNNCISVFLHKVITSLEVLPYMILLLSVPQCVTNQKRKHKDIVQVSEQTSFKH